MGSLRAVRNWRRRGDEFEARSAHGVQCGQVGG